MSSPIVNPEELNIEEPAPEALAPPDDLFRSTFLDENEDIEIDEAGTPPPEVKTVEEVAELESLKTQLQAQQAKIAELNTRGQIREELAPLLSQLGQPQQQQQIVQQPQETDEAFGKRLDDSYLETGITGAMDEYFARRLRPEVQRLMQNNLYTSRRLAMLDPEKGPLYTKYRVDVDNYIAQLPPQKKLYSPDIYDEAINTVSMQHGDEILKEQVAQALEAEREKIKEELRKELGAPTSRPAHSATSTQQPAPVPRATGTRMSLAQLKGRYPEHVKDAFNKGIPIHTYFKYLAKKGELKR